MSCQSAPAPDAVQCILFYIKNACTVFNMYSSGPSSHQC
ncbi:unnamed protein product, partial [Staurois parvus]